MPASALPRYPMLDTYLIQNIDYHINRFIIKCSTQGVSPHESSNVWDKNNVENRITFGHEGNWTASEHDLLLEIGLTFRPPCLFGENGIAAQGTVLGVLLEWTSPDSGQRGYSRMAGFKCEEIFDETFDLVFEAGQIRGTVDLVFSFYVADPVSCHAGSAYYFASKKGLFLGSLPSQCQLVFDGDGSVFPVVTFMGDKGAPLWKILFLSDNPREDKFSTDHVCLEINAGHPDYPQFNGEQEQKGHTSLRRQVFAAWLTLFLVILKEKHKALFDSLVSSSDTDYESGSIADAAKRLLGTFGLDSLNTEDLSVKINNLVDRKLLDGGSVS